MTPAEAGRPWSAVSASVRGSQHDRTGLPNQDAVTTVTVSAPIPAVIAAVADGHGGARYVRSDTGARAAIQIACEGAAELLTQLSAAPVRSLGKLAQTILVPTIVERWRREVLDDLARRPFTAAEQQRGGGALDDDPVVAYGATLLVAVATDAWVLLVQLGDGDIVVTSADGRTSTPVPGDDRLAGGQTTSLCLPTAVTDARVAVVGPAERAELVVLSSDGYGNSFADPDWRTTVARDLHQQVRRNGLDQAGRDLPGWLADSARVGGDDVSVALLARTLKETERGAARRRSAIPLIAVATVAALAVGAAAGWALKTSPAATSAPPPSTEVATTVAVLPTTTPTTTPTTSIAATTTTSTTIAPTTTSVVAPPDTTAPAPVAPVPVAWMWGPNDEFVVFPTENIQSAYVVAGGPQKPQAYPGVVSDGQLDWSITDKHQLVAKKAGTTDTPRRPPGVSLEVSALTIVGDHLWVLSLTGDQLVSVDLVSPHQVSNPLPVVPATTQ